MTKNLSEDNETSDNNAPYLFRWAVLTLSGGHKPGNEDSYLLFSASPKGMRTLSEKGEEYLSSDDLFFGISDGMGGGNAGNVASSLLLEELSRVIPRTFHMAASGFRPDYPEYLEKTIQYVHEGLNICADVKNEWTGMSATLILAWFTPENLYLANVGDSRLYRCRNSETLQLSRDHTFAWTQWKRGAINEYQYRSHPRRSALYEVVGGGHQFLTPYISAHSIQRGDRFLLCTDGVVDGLWERHIGEYMADEGLDIHQLARTLGNRAMETDNRDDKTLIIIEIG